jgi:NAD(P)-dependent dehydrogenase (short-subunit alcohol dehydrogenase family)
MKVAGEKRTGVFLITGGSRGIGAATARLAAERGYKVAFFYRSNTAAAEKLAQEIGALAVQADVTDERAVMRGFEAVDRLGKLEVLVNNAGVTGAVGRFADLAASDIEQVMRVNVTGAFLASREAVKRLSTRHGGAGGAIVNVSSGAARTGSPGVWIHYAASKAALDTLTLGLAKEVAAEGIRVNGVRPGLIDTEIHAVRPPGQLAKIAKSVPMGRIGAPEEIARTIVWLASAEASYVTAAILDAAGGF